MPAKLNQVIAVVAGKKSKVQASLTTAYHVVQKSAQFEGITKTYQPKDEDGDKLPSESKAVQTKVGDVIKEVVNSLTELFDVVATQDNANTKARSDVVVGSKKVLTNVPVTNLLFLEKQLKDVETFISKLPTLDATDAWHYEASQDSYATLPSETTRVKKMPRFLVKYEATKEHPAQVETYSEDTVAGYWRTVKYSGAIPMKEKNKMLDRVHQLQEAVVKAREEANSIEVEQVSVGKQVFDHIFGE